MAKKTKKFNPVQHINTSYGKYVGLDYLYEQAYLKKLSPEELEWLNEFIKAYYFRTKDSFDKLGFTTEQRRDSYNKHRGVVNDIFHKNKQVDLTEITGENDND